MPSVPANVLRHRPLPSRVDRSWALCTARAEAAAAFESLDAVFQIRGETITRCPISELVRAEIGGERYYVKRYRGRGKGMRAWLGRSRARAEWENLHRFRRWGIDTASLVGHGQRGRGRHYHGALITAELPGTRDLESLYHEADPRLRERAWVEGVSRQLARATRILHGHRFAHNDLKWRNVLVDEEARVHLIDCPAGRFWFGPFLRYRIVKDLACLDKVARRCLSRTQRLRFYLHYVGRSRLTPADRRTLRRVVSFFRDRDE